MTAKRKLFNETVENLLFGCTSMELDEKLNECVLKARETGKMATLTLTLKIKPTGKGQYEIKDQIKQVLPEMDRGSTILFGTPEGNLTNENPEAAKKRDKVRPVKELRNGGLK